MQEIATPSGVVNSSNSTITFEEVEASSVGTVENVKSKIRRKLGQVLSKETLFRRLRILEWLPKYNREDAILDFVAGTTVGLCAVPGSLSFANIAGLPPEYGLYSSFLGPLVYIIFGTCKKLHMGSTPIVSLLTLQAVHGMGPDFAILLCFFTGLLQIAMGLFNLGFLIDYISRPVSIGFTYALLLIIVTSQLKDALGIPVKGFTFIEQWTSIGENLNKTQVGDVVVTLTCSVIILVLQFIDGIRLGKSIDEAKYPKKKLLYRTINKLIWLISATRLAMALLLFGCVGYIFEDAPFQMMGHVPPGLPQVQLPPFMTSTNGTHLDLLEMLSELGGSVFVVPLISMVEALAIIRFFSGGNSIDVTQELLAVGTSNFLSSFVQAFPGGGSFNRSIVLHECQVRTPMANLYSSLMSVALLLFFSEYLGYIPKACLAAILLVLTLQMLEVRTLRKTWMAKKSELVPTTITFLGCLLLRIEVGILIGIGVNLFLIIYNTGRPKVEVKKVKNEVGSEYLLVSPDRWIIFTSAENFRNSVMKEASRGLPVFVDCTKIYRADYTSAVVVESMCKDFKERRQILAFCNLKTSVRDVLAAMSSEKLVICATQEDIDRLIEAAKC